MITTPNLEKYRQGDFIQYINNVLEIVTPARATDFSLTRSVMRYSRLLLRSTMHGNRSWAASSHPKLPSSTAGATAFLPG